MDAQEFAVIWGCRYSVHGVTEKGLAEVATGIEENGYSWFNEKEVLVLQILEQAESHALVCVGLALLLGPGYNRTEASFNEVLAKPKRFQKMIRPEEFLGYFSGHGMTAELLDPAPAWVAVSRDSYLPSTIMITGPRPDYRGNDGVVREVSDRVVGVSFASLTSERAWSPVDLTARTLGKIAAPLTTNGVGKPWLRISIHR
jgi:hypothetical protein